MRAEYKRLAFQLKLMFLSDPAFEREMNRFHIVEPLNRFFETEYGLRTDLPGSASSLFNLGQSTSQVRPIPGKAARRSLKLMRQQLRNDMCRLVEKVQLLRALDPAFESEIHYLGWTRALDTIARWHTSGQSQ